MSNDTAASAVKDRILNAIHPDPTIQLGNATIYINSPPPFHTISSDVAVEQNSIVLWRIAIAYYNSGKLDDFRILSEQKGGLLQLARCSLSLVGLFDAEQSFVTKGQFMNQFESTINLTQDPLYSLRNSLSQAEQPLQTYLQDNVNAEYQLNLFKKNNRDMPQLHPHFNMYNQGNIPYDDRTRRLHELTSAAQMKKAQYDRQRDVVEDLKGQIERNDPHNLYSALVHIILALLQFVRIAQSATLEDTDTTKLKERPPHQQQHGGLYNNNANQPASTQQHEKQLLRTYKNDDGDITVKYPSLRQETLSVVKSTLLAVSAQNPDLTPLCYLVLGTIAMYEAQYTIAIRFLCFALAKNPLLPPTVRLAIGYAHYYKQQYHEAKMSFVRALNICLLDRNHSYAQLASTTVGETSTDQLLGFNAKNQCMKDAILGVTVTELAVLHLEIKQANNLIDSYEKKRFLGETSDEQLQQYATLQAEQFELIEVHMKRIYTTLNALLKNLSDLHSNNTKLHPIFTLYFVQLQLARAIYEERTKASADVDIGSRKRALSVFLTFFQWDPSGSSLHQYLTLGSTKNGVAEALNGNEILVQSKCDVTDIITTLSNLTGFRSKLDPTNTTTTSNTLYRVTLNPIALVQSLLYLAHAFFIQHRFVDAEDCYLLAYNKLSATRTIATHSAQSQQLAASLATAMAAAGITQQEQNDFHTDTTNTLRTICQLQISRCHLISDKLTHACTSINRAISSLPPSCATLAANESMYVNLEQYLFYQHQVRTKGDFFGLADKTSQNAVGRYVNIGGPDGKGIKKYTDLELSVNASYVQIMTAYFNARRDSYHTVISAKYNSEVAGVGSGDKKSKPFYTSTQVQQSMPLLSVLAATCLYHHEQRLLIEQDDKPTQFTHVDETLHYLLNLAINAVIVDLSVVQDHNILFFGLFAMLRLLNIDFGPLYNAFYPVADDAKGNIYQQTQTNNTKILSLLQQVQLTIFRAVVSTSVNDDSIYGNGDDLVSTTLRPLKETFKYFTVATWSNLTTLCSILCVHYQQFNTRSYTLKQSQLTEFISRNKRVIYHNDKLQNGQNINIDESMGDSEPFSRDIIDLLPKEDKLFDGIQNSFVPFLLKHTPQSIHHVLLGSPVSLVPATTIDMASGSMSGGSTGGPMSFAAATSASSQNNSQGVNLETMIATLPQPHTNIKERFPYLQHASYLSLVTSTQHEQQKKSTFAWKDISTPATLLLSDNALTILLTIALSTTIAMSVMESGAEYANGMVEMARESLNSNISQKIKHISSAQSDLDALSALTTKHQYLDGTSGTSAAPLGSSVGAIKPLFYSIFGILVPLPVPVSIIPVLESLILPMRTFYLTYPFDKYSPNAMRVDNKIVLAHNRPLAGDTGAGNNSDHFFNIFTYGLHHVRSESYLDLLRTSSEERSGVDPDPIISTTPQQYHLSNYLNYIVVTSGLALSLTGIVLNTHGSNIPLRLIRADIFLQLHDLFTTLESIRQKIHYTTTITSTAMVNYQSHIDSTAEIADEVENGTLFDPQLAPISTQLAQHTFLLAPQQLEKYTALTSAVNNPYAKTGAKSTSILSQFNPSFFNYIDFEVDYMGFSIYFGHSAVAILRLLQDMAPERPILAPLQQLPVNYYNDMINPDTTAKITAMRYRHNAQLFEKSELFIGQLPNGFGGLDLSTFDDFSTVLTSHGMLCYQDLLQSHSFTPNSTQILSKQSQRQQEPGAPLAPVSSIYAGHLHPFIKKRWQRQKTLKNTVIVNSDCVLIGRNVQSQLVQLINDQSTAMSSSGSAIQVPKGVPSQQRTFPRCLFIQLHFTHPHLICSDGSLYSAMIPSFYPEITLPQLTYISNNWSWYLNQSGSSQAPPMLQQKESTNGSKKPSAPAPSCTVEPNVVFPYMYTHVHLHHQTIQLSATSRLESALKAALVQLGSTTSVHTSNQHSSASLRGFLLSLYIIHKFKKTEKDRIKLIRLRDSMSQKQYAINGLKAQLVQLEQQGTAVANNAAMIETVKNATLQQQKRWTEFKTDCDRSIGEMRANLFEVMGVCNSIILGTSFDAIEFIQSARSKANPNGGLPLGQSKALRENGKNVNNNPSIEDSASTHVLAIIISILASMALLKEHITSTPVKDQDSQRIKTLNVQHNLRQMKTLLIKTCLSNTSTYQFTTSTTMYHPVAPLSLVLNPGRLHLPLTNNTTSNVSQQSPFSFLSPTSTSSLTSTYLPTPISTVLVIFQTLSMLNEALNNYDDALFFSYITATLNGQQKTLALTQHPLFFTANASQIYTNDYRNGNHGIDNIRTNLDIAQGKVVVETDDNLMGDEPTKKTTYMTPFSVSKQHTTDLTTALLQTYPTKAYLGAVDKNTYSYHYAPSVLDCDLIYLNHFLKILRKQQLSPITLLSETRHNILLSIITQHSLDSFIDYSNICQIAVKTQQSQNVFKSSLFPYGKFDSSSFSSYIQNAVPTNITAGLFNHALRGIIQTCPDLLITTSNLASTIQQLAITMYRYYVQIVGGTSTALTTAQNFKFNTAYLYFGLISLLQLQHPEVSPVGQVTIELTAPTLTQVLTTHGSVFSNLLAANPSLFESTSLGQVIAMNAKQGKNKQLHKGATSLSSFDSASLCYVANFLSSSLYAQLRSLLTPLLAQAPANPVAASHLGVGHYLPVGGVNAAGYGLSLPGCYQSFSSSAITTGTAPYRTLTLVSRVDLGIEQTTQLFGTIQVGIAKEQERTEKELVARQLIEERALFARNERDRLLEIEASEQTRKLDEAQVRAKVAQDKIDVYIAQQRELKGTIGVDGEVRDMDKLPAKVKKSRKSTKNQDNGDFDDFDDSDDEGETLSAPRSSKKDKKSDKKDRKSDKKDKKSKKDKKDKRRSSSSRRSDSTSLDSSGAKDFDSTMTHFGDDDDSDSDGESITVKRQTTFDAGTDSDDDGDNFIRNAANNDDTGGSADDENAENGSVNSAVKSSKYDLSDDDDFGAAKSVKKQRLPADFTDSSTQQPVSIGAPTQPVPPVQPQPDQVDAETAGTKRRFIINDDDSE